MTLDPCEEPGVKVQTCILHDGVGVLFIPGRPRLLNKERSASLWEHRRDTKASREVATMAGNQLLAKGYKAPTQAFVWSQPVYTRKPWPDTGNWYPTHKATVDGLTDSGLWPDDTPGLVSACLMTDPVKSTANGLIVYVLDLANTIALLTRQLEATHE